MKQENKKQQKNRQMRSGFSMLELMFVILLLISLATIANNILQDSTKTGVLASMMSDFKNAQKQMNDYAVIAKSPLGSVYKDWMGNNICSARDYDNSGLAGDADDEIYWKSERYKANEFPLKFQVSEGNELLFKHSSCNLGYKMKVVNVTDNDPNKEIFIDTCKMAKPVIRDKSDSWN